jgi:GT2 family glycosyltransferase
MDRLLDSIGFLLQLTLAEGFEYLIMLNTDTALAPSWLAALVEAADERPDAHILQSAILLYGSEAVNTLGNRIHYLGFGYCGGYGRQATTRPIPVIDYASGAAMLVKRAVFETIGLFREDYFAYYDDMEFCWRARLAGFNVELAERSVCYHKYRVEKPAQALYYLQRNRLMTFFTLPRLRTLCLTLPCLIVAEGVLTVYFIARGRGATQWQLLRFFLHPRTWRSIIANRRAIRRLRRRGDAEIVRGFAGTIAGSALDHPLLRYVFNPLLMAYWAMTRVFIVW